MSKKSLFLILFIIFAFISMSISNIYALNLSRVKSWISGEILTAADLNAEFNNITNHSIANADIASDAAIEGSKLNMAVAPAIGGTTPNTGAFSTLSATGNFTASGTTNAIGNGGSDTLTFNTPSGIIYTPEATWTFTAAQTVSGTWANLGTITTCNIDGGTIDGATIGANSAGAGIFTDLSSTGTTTIGNATGDAFTINPSAWTLANAVTITGTWTNLGTVTTVDINGGTLDGVTIGGASAGAITCTTLDTGGKLTAGANEIEGSNFDINGGTIDGITSLTAGGDLDVGAYELRAQTFESDVTTGTAPFVVASTTKVDNLNADTIDGNDSTTFVGKQLFTSSGTFTSSAGITMVYITLTGGGGGGAGSNGGANGGGGGGAGAWGGKIPIVVDASTQYTVTVGAAGSAGAIANNGGNGGNSSFAGKSITVTANGGSGGVSAGGTGGAGGTASANSSLVTIAGRSGSNESAGISGAGAGSFAGNGGGETGETGIAGTGYGSGGSGGGTSGGSHAGAVGTAGLVLVEW